MTATTEWLVIAAICDCPRIAITVMNSHQPGNTQAGENEVTATGPDWRPLVPTVARALMDRTGLPLSGMCTTALTKDEADRQVVSTELTNLVYAIAEGAQS